MYNSFLLSDIGAFQMRLKSIEVETNTSQLDRIKLSILTRIECAHSAFG